MIPPPQKKSFEIPWAMAVKWSPKSAAPYNVHCSLVKTWKILIASPYRFLKFSLGKPQKKLFFFHKAEGGGGKDLSGRTTKKRTSYFAASLIYIGNTEGEGKVKAK